MVTYDLKRHMTGQGTPTVLVVEDDEKLLETYEMWLDSTYDLRTASGGEAALDELDAEVDIVLLDRLMPGLSGDQVLDRIRESDVDCQVAMVTAVEPDEDIATMPFDAYVPKAVDRETVVDTIERLVARIDYDDLVREHYAVAEKLSVIEARTPEAKLATSEAYQELRERFQELESRLADREAELDRDDIVNSIDAIGTSDGGQADTGGSDDS
jgi:DNA-binding response OmpR family regulator